MGEKDVSEKMLQDYNDVFADIVNALLFNGREVIKPDELEEQVPRSAYKVDDELREVERDVVKRWKKGGVRIACIGFENQTNVDADMPLRVIGYDGAEYRSQLSKGKDRYPVVTLVLYFGEKHRWNKPLNLKDCFEIPEDFQPFVSDYKINLFEIAYLDDEQVNLFKSDFREIADYLVCERKGVPYKGSKTKLKHAWATFQLLAVLRNDPRYETICNDSEKGVPQSMDAALDRIINEGRREGEAKGEAKLAKLIDMLLSKQDYDSVSAVTKDAKIRESYYKKYGIA